MKSLGATAMENGDIEKTAWTDAARQYGFTADDIDLMEQARYAMRPHEDRTPRYAWGAQCRHQKNRYRPLRQALLRGYCGAGLPSDEFEVMPSRGAR